MTATDTDMLCVTRYDNANNNLMYNRYNAISQYINTQSISDNYVGAYLSSLSTVNSIN